MRLTAAEFAKLQDNHARTIPARKAATIREGGEVSPMEAEATTGLPALRDKGLRSGANKDDGNANGRSPKGNGEHSRGAGGAEDTSGKKRKRPTYEAAAKFRTTAEDYDALNADLRAAGMPEIPKRQPKQKGE